MSRKTLYQQAKRRLRPKSARRWRHWPPPLPPVAGRGEESYTHRLLAGAPDAALKKVMEEAGEVALAAKDVEALPCVPDAPSAERDAAIDHLRYERQTCCTMCSWCWSATTFRWRNWPPNSMPG